MSYGISIPANPAAYEQGPAEPPAPVAGERFDEAVDEAVRLHKSNVKHPEETRKLIHSHIDLAARQVKALVKSGKFGAGPFTAAVHGHVADEGVPYDYVAISLQGPPRVGEQTPVQKPTDGGNA